MRLFGIFGGKNKEAEQPAHQVPDWGPGNPYFDNIPDYDIQEYTQMLGGIGPIFPDSQGETAASPEPPIPQSSEPVNPAPTPQTSASSPVKAEGGGRWDSDPDYGDEWMRHITSEAMNQNGITPENEKKWQIYLNTLSGWRDYFSQERPNSVTLFELLNTQIGGPQGTWEIGWDAEYGCVTVKSRDGYELVPRVDVDEAAQILAAMGRQPPA